MAEGGEMTNWMETIIFLPPWQSWGEGGDAFGCVPVVVSQGTVHGSCPADPCVCACTLPTPPRASEHAPLANVPRPVGSLESVTQASLTGSGITDSQRPYFVGPMGEHSTEEEDFFPERRQHKAGKKGLLRGS